MVANTVTADDILIKSLHLVLSALWQLRAELCKQTGDAHKTMLADENMAAHVEQYWCTHIVTGHFAGYNKACLFLKYSEQRGRPLCTCPAQNKLIFLPHSDVCFAQVVLATSTWLNPRVSAKQSADYTSVSTSSWTHVPNKMSFEYIQESVCSCEQKSMNFLAFLDKDKHQNQVKINTYYIINMRNIMCSKSAKDDWMKHSKCLLFSVWLTGTKTQQWKWRTQKKD